MDPISVALLAALAGGAGGEIGRQAWAGLSALVRRPFRRGQDESPDVPAVSSGETELAELEEAPADPARAQALSTALAVRATLDTDFHSGLQRWHEQAKLVRTGDGEVHNTISGGTFHGPALQGRDFSNVSFTTPHLPPPAAPGSGTPPTQG
ncbi:hypothetical protein ACFWWT_48685 [Streptomyces sp. NPDC058676]|uniref:hypothetical protein n=1 Tax=unclassified Streptomyces TaxID=2593676 RepID=UPI0036620491